MRKSKDTFYTCPSLPVGNGFSFALILPHQPRCRMRQELPEQCQHPRPDFRPKWSNQRNQGNTKGKSLPDVRLMGQWLGAGCEAGISLLSRAKTHEKQSSRSSKAKAIFVSFRSHQEKVCDQAAHISCI